MSLEIEEQTTALASPRVQTESPRRSGMARLFGPALKALPCSHRSESPTRTSLSCFGRSGNHASAQRLNHPRRMSRFVAGCFGGCSQHFRHPDGSRTHILTGNEVHADQRHTASPSQILQDGHNEDSEIQSDHSGDGTAAHGTAAQPELGVVIAELRDAVNNLALSLPNPKDPLAKLEKKRESLAKFVLFIGGLTSISIIMTPPGGLDSNGHIRFRHLTTFKVFFVFAEVVFSISTINYAILSKELDEDQSVEEKIKTLKSRLLLSWIILWITAMFFLVVYVTGFWLIYPEDESALPLHPTTDTLVKNETHHRFLKAWPRYLTLIFLIAKFLFCVCYYFGFSLIRRARQYLNL